MKLVPFIPLHRFAYSILVILVGTMPMVLQASDPPANQAQQKIPQAIEGDSTSKKTDTPENADRYARLEKMLSNVRLVGHFTLDGKPLKDLKEEKYEIKSAKKLPEGNSWSIAARIQYGSYDVTLPLVMDILWADETPVLTLNQFSIPGLGTFDARVMFHDGKYSGTWRHDAAGGHLFGRIEPIESVEPKP